MKTSEQNQPFMIFPYALAFAILFALLIYQDQHLTIIALTLIISVLFYTHQCIVAKTYGLRKVFTGDFVYQLGFMVWLVAFRVPYFMHYIPLLLSNVGKIHIMVTSKHGEHPSSVHELIIFQNQTETFIMVTLLIEFLTFDRFKIIRALIYCGLVKLKYMYYSPTRKAYN